MRKESEFFPDLKCWLIRIAFTWDVNKHLADEEFWLIKIATMKDENKIRWTKTLLEHFPSDDIIVFIPRQTSSQLRHIAVTIWASAWDFQQCVMCDLQSLLSACAYAQSDQSLC